MWGDRGRFERVFLSQNRAISSFAVVAAGATLEEKRGRDQVRGTGRAATHIPFGKPRRKEWASSATSSPEGEKAGSCRNSAVRRASIRHQENLLSR
ncbi:UNVERIFIED_CONTAM: hypothetical protein K2H54_017098 [Gekko kuhli]